MVTPPDKQLLILKVESAHAKKHGPQSKPLGWSERSPPDRTFLIQVLYYLDPDDYIFESDYVYKHVKKGFPEWEVCVPMELLEGLPANYKSGSWTKFTLNKKGKALEFQLKVL